MHFEAVLDFLLHLNIQVNKLVLSYRVPTYGSLRDPFAQGFEALLGHLGKARSGGVEALDIIMDVEGMQISHPQPVVQGEFDECRRLVAEKVQKAGADIKWNLKFVNTAHMQYRQPNTANIQYWPGPDISDYISGYSDDYGSSDNWSDI